MTQAAVGHPEGQAGLEGARRRDQAVGEHLDAARGTEQQPVPAAEVLRGQGGGDLPVGVQPMDQVVPRVVRLANGGQQLSPAGLRHRGHAVAGDLAPRPQQLAAAADHPDRAVDLVEEQHVARHLDLDALVDAACALTCGDGQLDGVGPPRPGQIAGGAPTRGP